MRRQQQKKKKSRMTICPITNLHPGAQHPHHPNNNNHHHSKEGQS